MAYHGPVNLPNLPLDGQIASASRPTLQACISALRRERAPEHTDLDTQPASHQPAPTPDVFNPYDQYELLPMGGSWLPIAKGPKAAQATRYDYTASDTNGMVKRGSVEAPDESSAAALLHKQLLFVTSLKPAALSGSLSTALIPQTTLPQVGMLQDFSAAQAALAQSAQTQAQLQQPSNPEDPGRLSAIRELHQGLKSILDWLGS